LKIRIFFGIHLFFESLVLKKDNYTMSTLEEILPQIALRGIVPDALVIVVNVQWFGSEALELTYKTASGAVANELLYRGDEDRIEVVGVGRPWSFDGDGRLFRLVSEANRIRLAHLFDPVLAVHTSLVDPLPHQITAVYDSMLPRHVGAKIQTTIETKLRANGVATHRCCSPSFRSFTCTWKDGWRSSFGDKIVSAMEVASAKYNTIPRHDGLLHLYLLIDGSKGVYIHSVNNDGATVLTELDKRTGTNHSYCYMNN